MLGGIHPGWFGLALTVFGLVFAAGGYYAGSGRDTSQIRKSINHLDNVKQSTAVCEERHKAVDDKLNTIIAGQRDITREIRKMNGAT